MGWTQAELDKLRKDLIKLYEETFKIVTTDATDERNGNERLHH